MKELTNADVFDNYAVEGEEPEWFSYPHIGYLGLVKSMGVDVLKHETVGSYQGDYLLIVKEGDRHGYLEFGYGSCSGCDALQGCGTLDEVTSLRQRLYDSVHWEATAGELAQWMRDRDWEAQWVWHETEAAEFVRAAAKMLDGEVTA